MKRKIFIDILNYFVVVDKIFHILVMIYSHKKAVCVSAYTTGIKIFFQFNQPECRFYANNQADAWIQKRALTFNPTYIGR